LPCADGFESSPGQYPLENKEGASEALGKAQGTFSRFLIIAFKKNTTLCALISEPDDNAAGTVRAPLEY